MLKPNIAVLICVGLLAGCSTVSESRLNPFNWGKSIKSAVTEEEIKPLVPQRRSTVTVDNRSMVNSITRLDVADVTGGVLVTATGVPSVAGAYNVELVVVSVADGKMELEFRAQSPERAVGGKVSPVTASHIISANDAKGINVIQVRSRTNALSRRN